MVAAVDVMPLGVFDDPRYARLALDNAEAYQGADAFPHLYIDNFLPVDLARALAGSFPEETQGWVAPDNVNNRRKYQHDETQLPPMLRHMLREFNARQFLLFLETLTGIECLFPDPYFIGGGAHMSTTDDFLKIHADFNWHHKLQAHRRCNALLYLNEDWEESWGGWTEVWSRDMSHVVDKVSPMFNRLFVFSTSEISNHGQPTPNACPPGQYRKVLNLYYYTSQREDEFADATPHFTVYKTGTTPAEAMNLDPSPEASRFAQELGESYRASAAPPGS